MASPIVHVLHTAQIRELTDGKIYRRGAQYHREGRVSAITREDHAIRATVSGSQSYEVTLWVKAGRIAYACSCPMGVEGGFCKHCVAVALSFLS